MAEVELPNPKELHEQSEDRFGRRVALVTAVFAVILSISSLGGNNATKEMLLAQQKSSDQWNFYQAKVIREHLYRAQKQRLEADLIERGPAMSPAAREKLEAVAKKWDEEEKRYNAEKKDIEKDAKKLEHLRDHHRARDPNFEYAEIFLQIAIVTASVAILAESKAMFIFSLVSAIAGAVLTANGFVFGLPLPFAGHH